MREKVNSLSLRARNKSLIKLVFSQKRNGIQEIQQISIWILERPSCIIICFMEPNICCQFYHASARIETSNKVMSKFVLTEI